MKNFWEGARCQSQNATKRCSRVFSKNFLQRIPRVRSPPTKPAVSPLIKPAVSPPTKPAVSPLTKPAVSPLIKPTYPPRHHPQAPTEKLT